MKTRIALSLFGAAVVMVWFQNCGNKVIHSTATSDELVTKVGEQPNMPSYCQGIESGCGEQPTPIPDPIHPDPKPDSGLPEAGAGQFFCIVDGPGASTRVGFDAATETLVEETGVPDLVCMSEEACTDIVSQIFPVKFPKKAGPCHNNKHVVHFSNQELQDIVNVMKGN